MRTLTVTFEYTFNGETNEREIELNEDSTEQTVREEIAEALEEMAQEQRGEDEQGETITADMVELNSVESSEASISSKYLNLEDIFNFANAYCQCDQEADVVEAALECGIEGDNIDEAYNGEYDSDEDFARETAEQLGAVDKNATWPNTCIDW